MNLKCNYCDNLFKTQSGLKNHIYYKHSKRQSYNCKHCNRIFTTQSGLGLHIYYKHNTQNYDEYKCDECDKICKTISGLKTHKRFKHSNEIFTCNICEQTFNSTTALKLHNYYQHEGYVMKAQGWNKGKTKDNDERIKEASEKVKIKYYNGTIKKPFLDKKHTQKTKDLISKKASESKHRRLVRSTRKYINKEGNEILLDSSWEEKLAKRLDYIEIDWIRPEVPLPYLDQNNKERNYFPDFYLPNYDIYIDPKNPYALKVQYYKVKKIKELYNNVFFFDNVEICETIDVNYINKLINNID